MKRVLLSPLLYRCGWDYLAQVPVVVRGGAGAPAGGCAPNHFTVLPQLRKPIFRGLCNLHAWIAHLTFSRFQWWDSSHELLSPDRSLPSLPALPHEVIKMGARLTVIDGLNADHSLPLLAHGKYLLFVTQEQWGFIQEMDVERIYNCLSESFEQPTLISLGSLGGRGGGAARWVVWLFRGRSRGVQTGWPDLLVFPSPPPPPNWKARNVVSQ